MWIHGITHINTNMKYRNQTTLGVDANGFINCTTPHHAYVLGFAWADGHLLYKYKRKEIRIEIVKEDMDILIPTIRMTGKWYHASRKRKNRKEQSIASVSNSMLCDYLHDNGYLEKSKISPDKILKQIPEKYHKFFLRGWVDGDGCFYMNKTAKQFSIAGSFEQDWGALESIFTANGIKYTVQRRQIKETETKITRASYIRITNKPSLIILDSLLYDDKYDGIGLYRKYKKCKEIISL